VIGWIFDLLLYKASMKNQLILSIFVALGATLVAGLVAIPAIEQAVQAEKGGIPNSHASIKARGRGSVDI
jgi:hypothetical protein